MSTSTMSRRNFVATAAAAGAAAGIAAAVAPAARADEATVEAAGPVDEITQRLLDRGVAGADLPNARPIPPEPAPEAWDAEADVVVVGLGGGGLTATGLLAENGYSVIAIDKDAITGGSSRHACSFVDLVGGTKGQIEFGFEGRWGGDDMQAMRVAQVATNFSMSNDLLRTLLAEHVEAVEWVVDQPNMQLASIGRGYHDIDVIEGRQNRVMGMNNTMNTLTTNAKANGADIRLLTACEAFVVDGGRIAGVKVEGPEGHYYIKAGRGIVLDAGGIGMNKDLIKAYLPSVYEGAVLGGPMPSHTGEVFRMGLGVGADFAGFDSWCTWEGAIDESIAGGDGHFWHYFWHGERQLFHNPWLLINKCGERLPYLANVQDIYQQMSGNPFDLTTTNGFVSTIGHHAYSICDSKFAEDIFKKYTCTEEFIAGGGDGCRIPLTDPDLIIPEAAPFVSADWLSEVEEAAERGAVKKADTLEELAQILGLEPEIVVKAVEDYNALCEKGVDDEMPFPYDPSWLTPIDTPPYYAAIVGGQIGKTLCGLRINKDFQVVNEDGEPLGGLYAGFSTAGGLHGEGNYGCFMNGGMFFGGVGSSIITGYIAAKKLMELE